MSTITSRPWQLARPRVAPFTPARPSRHVACNVQTGGGDIRGSGMEKALFGEDFGARDPTAGEMATNFNESSLGNWNTDHLIRPPEAIKRVLGLTARSCQVDGSLEQLPPVEVERLRQQVPGWRVTSSPAGHAAIRQDWTAADADAAGQLAAQVSAVAAAEGHSSSLQVTLVGSTVCAELSSGGLTENDFIVAAKVNELQLAHLLAKKRQRFWA